MWVGPLSHKVALHTAGTQSEAKDIQDSHFNVQLQNGSEHCRKNTQKAW